MRVPFLKGFTRFVTHLALTLSLIFASPLGLVKAWATEGQGTGTTTTDTTRTRPSTPRQTTSNQNIGFSPSVNQSSGESKSQTAMAAASNGLSAAMFVIMGNENLEKNPGMAYVFYGMAALSVVQGVMAMKNSKQAGKANVGSLGDLGAYDYGDDSDNTFDFNSTDIPIPPSAVGPDGNPIGRRTINSGEVLNFATRNGLKVDPKTGTVTLPNGKTLDGKSLSSPGSMQALGISPADSKRIMDAFNSSAAQASAGYKVSRMDVDSSGGGGGGAKPSRSNAGDYATFKFPSFGDEKPKAANVAGLTKRLNGEPIGVAGDDIFRMMQRAYASRQGNGMFIEE